LNYIVFDLEYNQPSTLNKRLSQTMETGRPKYLRFEILQIGAIKLMKILNMFLILKCMLNQNFSQQ
jgi:hypothetical protein